LGIPPTKELPMTRLEQLGRQVIGQRIWNRRESARRRAILRTVNDCLRDPALSDSAFRGRILEAADRSHANVTEAEIEAEIAKL